jgi:hypothetical protein
MGEIPLLNFAGHTKDSKTRTYRDHDLKPAEGLDLEEHFGNPEVYHPITMLLFSWPAQI